MSSFKETNTIFTTARSLIPIRLLQKTMPTAGPDSQECPLQPFQKFPFGIHSGYCRNPGFFRCVAFGFARCQFRGKKLLFGAMLASMMLPGQILMVPQYLWYEKLGWVGSFAPLIVLLFCHPGILCISDDELYPGYPQRTDEAAKIDGCSYYGIFGRIILPLMSRR